MDYRKKASPLPKKTLPQKTLDEWLVAKKKINGTDSSNDDKKKGHTRDGSKGKESAEEATSRVELSGLLEKEKQEKASQGGDSAAPKTEPDSSAPQTEKGGSDDKTSEKQAALPTLVEEKDTTVQEKQQALPYPAPFVTRERSHPVKQIDVYPNALEYDDADVDVSLPPELSKEQKVKIWHEDNITLETAPSKGAETRTQRSQKFVDKWVMNCGDLANVGIADLDIDGNTFDMENTMAEENNTIVDKTEKTSKDDKNRSDADIDLGRRNRFVCGIDPEDLKKDLVYEAKEVVADVKFGVRKSMRSLFGACDITQDGGVEFMTKSVDSTKAQLFGHVPMARPRAPTTTASPTAAPPTAANAAAPSADNANPQAEKMTNILNGSEEAKKIFEGSTRNMKEGGIQQKKGLTIQEKRRLYLEKLKAVSMKHL